MTAVSTSKVQTVHRDPSQPRQTSITARTVLTVTVSMAGGDMDALCRILSNMDTYSLTEYENAVRSEFLDQIQAIR